MTGAAASVTGATALSGVLRAGGRRKGERDERARATSERKHPLSGLTGMTRVNAPEPGVYATPTVFAF